MGGLVGIKSGIGAFIGSRPNQNREEHIRGRMNENIDAYNGRNIESNQRAGLGGLLGIGVGGALDAGLGIGFGIGGNARKSEIIKTKRNNLREFINSNNQQHISQSNEINNHNANRDIDAIRRNHLQQNLFDNMQMDAGSVQNLNSQTGVNQYASNRNAQREVGQS